MLVHFNVHLYLLDHFHVSYLVHTTDFTRSQTDDTDWAKIKTILSLWQKGKLCAGCYCYLMALCDRLTSLTIFVRRKHFFNKFALYKSSKFAILAHNTGYIWKQTGDRDEAKENSGGRFGKS